MSEQIMIGYCRYCGSARQLAVQKEMPQHILNEMASSSCDCETASTIREREEQLLEAGAAIDAICGDKYKSAIEPLKGVIPDIQSGIIAGMNIRFADGTTMGIKRRAGGLVVSATQTKKEERTA